MRLVRFMAMLLALAAAPDVARAAPDYDPRSTEWNGLSALFELARREGVPLVATTELDAERLSPADGLFVVYPTRALPVGSLLAHLRAGGRIALADDFGTGDALLRRFAIERARAPDDRAARLRGNPGLLLARPRGAHPLSEGVGALVTNHPAALYHPELEPVFAYDDGPEALVLSGSVGAGRLAAIADPSVFINRMLALEGNRRFAAHVLRFLAEGGGRVYLVTGDAAVRGRDAPDPSAPPFERLDDVLRRIAHAELPAVVLTVAALLLCGIFASFASSAVSLRGPYTAGAILPPTRDAGSFSGWLRFYLDHPQNLLHPTLMYKNELEASLREELGLPHVGSTDELLSALAADARLGAFRADARALLEELARLEAEERAGGPAPRVSARRFASIRARGEAIVARVRAAAGAR